MNPKEYIEHIQQRILMSDREFALDSYAGSIDLLQKAFPRYGSFLMEFIQNADDAGSKRLNIKLLPDALQLLNDGKPFSQEDVDSICKVGRSSKKLQDSIGYLGVGFKAVFLICKSPEIHSGSWNFRFSKEHWQDASIPWQIVPLWTDASLALEEGFTTLFHLPLHPSEQEIIRSEQDELNSRILLFLNHLQELELPGRKIIKSLLDKTDEYEVVLIQEFRNNSLHHQDTWILFREQYEIPGEIKNDPFTIEWERHEIRRREVVAAFSLDGENNLGKEEKGTAHIGVFSFLPLKEIPSGLHFLIQADFLTMTGRGELARNCPWNNWLAAQLYRLIIDKCIPAFLRHEQWKYQFTGSLYASSSGHELFELHLKKPLREYLLHGPVLIAEDGTLLQAEKALAMDTLRKIIAAKDLERLYPSKKMLHPRCTPPPEIQSRIECGPSWNESEKLHKLLQLKAEDGDLPFFTDFYQKYLIPLTDDHKTHRITPDRNVILTEGFDLADVHSVSLNLENIAIPEGIHGFFKLVHPSLVQVPEICEFFQRLGVPVISEEDVQDLLRKKELVYLQQHWGSLPETTKIRKVQICKELWEKGNISSQHLEFLTLPNTQGEWREPQQLLLSQAYQPSHALDKLQEKGLLDFPLEFVDSTFSAMGQPERWREFLRALGVDARMSERRFRKNLIERIGILLAMNYEESRGRRASEIPRSKEIFGYDITIDDEEGEGFVQSAERYIEVKSSEKPNPDIFLTTRQYSTLQEKRDKYFVYIITDALKSPTLHITRGDKLLKITHIRTLIPFRKWWYEAKEEEYRGE